MSNSVKIGKFLFSVTEDRLLVEPVEPEEKSKGGIYIPQTIVERPQEGIVRSAGPGAFNTITGQFFPMAYEVGDRILFGKYTGNVVSYDGKDWIIMRQGDVLGKLVEEVAGDEKNG